MLFEANADTLTSRCLVLPADVRGHASDFGRRHRGVVASTAMPALIDGASDKFLKGSSAKAIHARVPLISKEQVSAC